MNNILVFTPAYKEQTSQNMADLIKFCKDDLTLFNPNFNWDDNHWPDAFIFFGNWEATAFKKGSTKALQQPLLDFAKSYLRYSLSFKQEQRARYEGTIFKCLEKALLEFGFSSDISYLTPAILDRAAEFARTRYTPSSCYHIGRNLQKLVEFLNEKNLIQNHIEWRNPNSRPSDTCKTGLKAEKIRQKKLPTDIALNALAEVFSSNPSSASDIFTTSTCALLLCVPSRVSEVLSLHVNCEVHELKRDGSKAYGIRFLPGKGAPPQIKWVPTAMVSLAQEAIRRIRSITNEARRISKWYEQNPDKFYRHIDCPAVNDEDSLTSKQRIQALGFSDKEIMQMQYANLSIIQKHVKSKQPEGFPFFDKSRNIKFSEALFCFQRGQLAPSSQRNISKVHVYRPDNNTLIGRISENGSTSGNFFDSHGYKNKDGTSVSLRSHALRHLLNTLAQKGGMSQLEIAKWSGRVEVKQNRVYDHMTEFEIVDMMRCRDSELSLDGPLEELRKKISEKLPIDRQSFNILAIPTAHITEIGYCVHDYTMSPCQKHLDCLNCTEQVCVKGDKRLENIQVIYEQSKALIAKMDIDIVEGRAGVDRWYEHTKMTLDRAETLLSILNNASIPNGSLIKLHNSQEYSPIKRALDTRVTRSHNNKDTLLEKARFLMEDL